MTGYTRQSSATITPGEIVRAAPLNAEFDLLQTAFSGATGHTHNGTTGNGQKILLTGASAISGILPIANGGTGFSTFAAAGLVTLTGVETITSKTIQTSTFSGGNVTDTSFRTSIGNFTLEHPTIPAYAITFDATSLTNSRNYVYPNISGTFVLEDNFATLTNKTITTPVITLIDSATTFEDNVDSSKKFRFQLSGLTTGTTRTLTVPDADTTLYARSNILGTASQSGGIPTGAIIETGSNANGSYVRYANGTQICYQVQSNTADAWTTASGSLFISSVYTWTFPIAFATIFPVLTGNVIRNSTAVAGISFASQSTTTATWYGWCASSAAGGTQKTASLMAIGAWY